MVSITRREPDIRTIDLLSPGDVVTIVACNSCPHYCGTGGRLAADHLAFRLRERGVTVARRELVTKVCIQESLHRCKVQGTIVLMACDSGLVSARGVWPDAVIIPMNETLGLGCYDQESGKATLLLPFPGYEGMQGEMFPKTVEEGPQ